MGNVNTKTFSEANMRKIISIIVGLQDKTQEISTRCVSPFDPDKLYTKTELCVIDNSIKMAITSAKGEWESVKDKFITLDGTTAEYLTADDIETMFNNVSAETWNYLAAIIVDDAISTKHSWSSSKIYMQLNDLNIDMKAYVLNELAKKNIGSYKIVSDTTEVTSTDFIYLITNGANYDMYCYIENTPIKIGDTSIDLKEYLKSADAESIYLKKTDATATYATITTVDGKFNTKNVLSEKQETPDDEHVLSEKAVVELIPVINSNLDENSTDIETASAKAVYDLSKKLESSIKSAATTSVVNLIPFPYTSSITKSGITFTPNSDGSINVKGTNESTGNLIWRVTNSLLGFGLEKGGTYTLSNTGTGTGSLITYIEYIKENTWLKNVVVVSADSEPVTFTLATEEELDYDELRFNLLVNPGITLDRTIYPMLEKGSEAHGFVKYVGIGESLQDAVMNEIANSSQNSSVNLVINSDFRKFIASETTYVSDTKIIDGSWTVQTLSKDVVFKCDATDGITLTYCNTNQGIRRTNNTVNRNIESGTYTVATMINGKIYTRTFNHISGTDTIQLYDQSDIYHFALTANQFYPFIRYEDGTSTVTITWTVLVKGKVNITDYIPYSGDGKTINDNTALLYNMLTPEDITSQIILNNDIYSSGEIKVIKYGKMVTVFVNNLVLKSSGTSLTLATELPEFKYNTISVGIVSVGATNFAQLFISGSSLMITASVTGGFYGQLVYFVD